MKRKTNTAYFVKIAMLGVLSYVIMLFEFSLPIFPSFLKFDFSDLIPLLGSLALGPVAGLLVELIKALLHFLTASTSGGVGSLANFIMGSAFVCTAGAVYSRHKTKKGAIAALGCGIVAIVVAAGFTNYYINIPFYGAMFFKDAGGIDGVIAMSAKVIPAIHSRLTLTIYAFCTFSLLKGVVLSLITIPLYKKVSPLLHKENLKSNKKERS